MLNLLCKICVDYTVSRLNNVNTVLVVNCNILYNPLLVIAVADKRSLHCHTITGLIELSSIKRVSLVCLLYI
jgi:hypothetical protein